MKRFQFALERKVERALMRMTEGLAGDRQFLAVIILGNLVYKVLPIVGILVLAILWWFI